MLNLRNASLELGPKQNSEAVDSCVQPGESVCLVGPSGCGKTSLLRVAAGLVEISDGSVENGFVLHGRGVSGARRYCPGGACWITSRSA